MSHYTTWAWARWGADNKKGGGGTQKPKKTSDDKSRDSVRVSTPCARSERGTGVDRKRKKKVPEKKKSFRGEEERKTTTRLERRELTPKEDQGIQGNVVMGGKETLSGEKRSSWGKKVVQPNEHR